MKLGGITKIDKALVPPIALALFILFLLVAPEALTDGQKVTVLMGLLGSMGPAVWATANKPER